MAASEVEVKCFIVDREKLCVSEEFRPGKFFTEGEWSRVKLIIRNSSVFSNAVGYIERHGDSRDNPGKSLYDYAANDPKRLQKVGDNESYTLFKSLAAGRDDDYLFHVKESGDFVLYGCAFSRVCTMQGSYKGKLSVRIDFETTESTKLEMALLLKEFMEVKGRIIKE